LEQLLNQLTKFERAQEENQKWLKKIEMHEQAARILEEVNDS